MFPGTVNNKTPASAERVPVRQSDNNSGSTSSAQPKAERKKKSRPTSRSAQPGSVPSSSHSSSSSSRSSHKKRDDFENSHTKPNTGVTSENTSSQHMRKTRPTTTRRAGVSVNPDIHIEKQSAVPPEPTAEPVTAEPATNAEPVTPAQETSYPIKSHYLPDWRYLDNDYFSMQHKSETQWKYYITEKKRLHEYETAKAAFDSYHGATLSAINLSSNDSNMDGILSTLAHSRNIYMAQKKKDADASLADALKKKGESSTIKK